MFDPNFLIHVASAAETAKEVANDPSIVDTLGLNLKLFAAQLINFAIVLFILWRWVFKPITSALQKRTEKIEHSLKTAEATEQQKQEFEKWKGEQIQLTKVEAGEILSKAKDEADALKNSMLIETKHDQDAVIEKAKKQLEVEKQQVLTQIRTEAADLVVSATEQILKEKLSETKDKDLIHKALSESHK